MGHDPHKHAEMIFRRWFWTLVFFVAADSTFASATCKTGRAV